MRNATRPKPNFLPQILIAAILLGLAQAWSSVAGENQSLFDGKDLAGWRKPTGIWMVSKSVSADPADPEKFVIFPGQGVLVNSAGSHTVDLITEAEFGDMEAHIEFCINATSSPKPSGQRSAH